MDDDVVVMEAKKIIYIFIICNSFNDAIILIYGYKYVHTYQQR